jgi:hypothetical protein
MSLFISELREKVIEMGASLSKKHLTKLHIAFLVKRGRVLAIASNIIGSRKMGAGYNTRSLHAEVAVVKKIGDVRSLEGADIFVFRWNPPNSSIGNQIGNSCPCHSCSVFLKKCMKKYRLNRVYYSS